MALSKANRLRSRQDFQAVYRQGVRRKSKYLTLLALRRSAAKHRKRDGAHAEKTDSVKKEPLPTRVGISISQKVSKRAVVRNRIKRWLKVGMRSLLPQFPVGWDLVILVQPEAVQCDYRQFLQELEQLLLNAEVRDGD